MQILEKCYFAVLSIGDGSWPPEEVNIGQGHHRSLSANFEKVSFCNFKHRGWVLATTGGQNRSRSQKVIKCQILKKYFLEF